MARASKDRPFEKEKFQRFKLIEAFRKALELQLLGRKPTSTESDPRRELTLPRYFTLFLFGLFNPMIKSMRGLCEASHFESVQKQLKCLPVSLGSFSAAQRLFDPELLKGVFEELSAGFKKNTNQQDPRLKDLQTTLHAVDGTLLKALPRMAWALYQDENNTAVKLHCKFELKNLKPAQIKLTEGKYCERKALKAMFSPGEFYIADRYYGGAYGYFDEIIEIGADFLIRIRNQPRSIRVLESFEINQPATQVGVVKDCRIQLGDNLNPLRWVQVQVDGKVFNLITNRMDLDADLISHLYRQRWQIETFFKWFKCLMSSRHWFAESPEGVAIQVYLTLIASLLSMHALGRAPNIRERELLSFYIVGMASLKELIRGLKIKR